MVNYLVSLGIFTAIFALFSLGLNLQWGYTGLINFGQVAFLGLGAYTTILLSSAGVPLIIAVGVGAILAALLGLGIGFSTLRLREDYLAIVTIGVAEVLQRVALNEEWLTRGARGVYGYPLPLRNFNPPLVVALAMVALLTAIVALAGWRWWQWLRHHIHGPLQPTAGWQGFSLIPYLVCLAGLQFSLWQLCTRGSPIFWFGAGLSLILAVGCCYIDSFREASQRQSPLKTLLTQGWPTHLILLTSTLLAGVLGVIYQSVVLGLFNNDYKSRLLWLVILVLALMFWQLERWVHSPWGRVLKAIREDEEVARALGKNVFVYKLQSFMLGGAMTGVAGAFYAWQLSFLEPKGTFDSLLTFQAWTIVVLGGSGNNAGTLLGAVIFWAYTGLTRFLNDALPLDDARIGAFRVMLIGLLLVVLMMWRPQGILGKKEELTLGR